MLTAMGANDMSVRDEARGVYNILSELLDVEEHIRNFKKIVED